MRACISLIGILGVAAAIGGCDAILGIGDHELASDASSDGPSGDAPPGPVIDGSEPDAYAPPEAGNGMDGGADAGDAAGPGDAGDASDAPTGCSAPYGTLGALTCAGNAPQQCDGGAWQLLPACAGASPICSNGVCGTFRTTGGIRSTAPSPVEDAGIFLVSGGFELGTRTCNDAGVCVTGGIVP